jgi:dihydrofolate synthase/folylpolyglutamate synthase
LAPASLAVSANNPRATSAARILALVAPLTNYERNRKDKPRWSLDNIRALLARPGATASRGLAVQVGGSKGKGTTALYLDALARHVGLRSGVYLSPHVDDVTERVQIGGAPAAMLEDVVRELVAFVARSGLADVSFFEVMTAAAAECYARAGVDLAVFEVGLGGRLDATTAIAVDAAILTNVELEHTELLGETVAAIAGEKAFILRPGKPAFTAANGGALPVIAARARSIGSRLAVLDRDFTLRCAASDPHQLRGVIAVGRERLPFTIPGAATFEGIALTLAVCCLRALRPDLASRITAALDPVRFRPQLPARCERIATPVGVFLVDGAHTERSLQATAAEAARMAPGHRYAVLFASAAGKRWQGGLSWLRPIVDTLYVTTLEGTAGEDPHVICAGARALGLRAEVVASAAAGLAALRRHAGPFLVTGSFYLAGLVRRLLGVT